MAKAFGLGSGTAPMAAPMAATAGPARAAMTPQRLEMIQALLSGAVQSAGQSGSPILAGLAPILGAVIGNSATKRYEEGEATRSQDMLRSVLGDRADDPQLQGILSVLNDDAAPGYLKEIARKQFEATVGSGGDSGGARRSSGGSRRSSGGGGSARPTRLTYIKTDADGITRGYNPATGKREVVPNADAPAAATPAAAAPSMPPAGIMDAIGGFGPPAAAPSPAITLPSDDDSLLRKYGAI